MTKKLLIVPALFALTAGVFTPPSFAQTVTTDVAPAKPSTGDLMPPVSAQSAAKPSESLDAETHPTLNLTPDKSELVSLDRDATSVVIGSPDQIGVMLDTPRLAVVIPRKPGATYFTVLDKDGKVIMQRHVIVAAPKKNYVRVRRSCANAATGTECKPTSVYFCPDMCHEVTNTGVTDPNAASSPPPQ